MWQLGDYDAVAQLVGSAGEACVRDARVGPGDEVLDVACGTGNAAIRAAHAGASVTGLDITPELLEIASAREPGVRWVQGDAEALPFGDASFDVVLSVFGELGARWSALRADLVELFASHGGGDGCAYEAEYLMAQATKTGVPTSVLS